MTPLVGGVEIQGELSVAEFNGLSDGAINSIDDSLVNQARKWLSSHEPTRTIQAGTASAAVLVLLYLKNGQLYVLLTERSQDVEYHKGEISFPGGAADKDDEDLQSTALRETFEEVGVQPQDVEVIGQLDDVVTITNFNVSPYVGLWRASNPPQFFPAEREVASILEVPVRGLLDDSNAEVELRRRAGELVLVPAYRHNGRHIWGTTAKILQQFLLMIS